MPIKRLLLFVALFVAIVLPTFLVQSHSQAAPGGPRIRLVYATFDPLRSGEPAVANHLRAHSDSRYGLLQFSGPVQPQWIDALETAGVTFYDYVPDYAYVVRLPTAGPDSVALSPGVRWIGALHPAYKISPAATGGALLLSLFPDANLAAVETAVSAAGARVLERADDPDVKLLVVEAEAGAIPALAAIEQVRWVQQKPQYRTLNDDARWVVQRYQPGQLPLYARGLTGAGQVGGVSDSGLDAYDFVNTTGRPAGTNPNDASCYFVDDGNAGAGGPQKIPGPDHRKVVTYTVPAGAGGNYTDESGHGTHVVGSVVGDRAPWGVVSPADGQAYEARILFQDLNVGGGLGISPPANYFNLFGPAYDPNGDGVYQPDLEPRTHSNSWGGPEPLYDAGTRQTDDFMWQHPDFLILFSAGNNGPAPSTTGNPGSAKNIVTVGSTENGDANPENMSEFSSHGPLPVSNRLKPTVGAPGSGIRSALYKNPCGTQEQSGTSMATPTTHGIALLMRQYLWEGFYPLGQREGQVDRIHPSAALLKALLMNSGRPMSGLFTDNKEAGGTWPSNGQGWGRVTADDALYFQGDHRDLWLRDVYAIDGSVGFTQTGQSQTFTLTAGDGSPFEPEPLEITLAWTDYPGSTMTNGALVNDLNLVVTDPNGGVHRGNNPDENDFMGAPPELVPALDGSDDVNPWEVVYLANPVTGTYTVTVSAANIGSIALDPRDLKQGFALVATGDLLGQRGRAEIEDATYDVAPTADARLRVVDLDLNTDSTVIETATTVVTSTTDITGTSVILTETAPDSAVFAGSVTLIALDDGQSTGPGQVEVHQGDTVRLTYNDDADGTGAPYVAYDTALVAAPALALLNPPELDDPGTTDNDGAYTLQWDSAETDNGRGTTKTLAYHQIQETTAYVEPLFDNAEGPPPNTAITDTGNLHWTSTTQNVATTPWLQNTAYVHSATRSYWSGQGEGRVVTSFTNTLTLKYDVTIPLTVTEGRLTFYSRYFNELDDSGLVDISTDGGTTWTPLLRLTDAPLTEPADTRVQHHEIDLTAFRGNPFRIRYRYGGGVTNYFAYVSRGWWVDDVTLSGGSWQTIGTAPSGQTSFPVAGRFDGHYHYRVRGVFTDGSATAWSDVEDVVVQGPGQPTATPTPGMETPTATTTPDTILLSPTPTAMATLMPTASATATLMPAVSPSTTATASPTPATPTPTPQLTALPSPSTTTTPMPGSTETATSVPNTATPTTTGTPGAPTATTTAPAATTTPTTTRVPATTTATHVPATAIPSPSRTPGASATITATPSARVTATGTPGATGTPRATATGTAVGGFGYYLPLFARDD